MNKVIRYLRLPLTLTIFILVFLMAIPTPALAATLTDTYANSSLINTGASSSQSVAGGQLKIGLVPAYGDGYDGDITVTANKNINTDPIAAARVTANKADGEAFAVSALGTNTITVTGTGTDGTAAASANTTLAAGDDVLLINLQGDTTNSGNVGNYEYLTVASVSSAVITLTSNIVNIYGATTSNGTLTGQKIMVQRVPNYANVTINTGVILNANAWDGTIGGVVAFKASGTVTVTGSISASALGYRGQSASGLGGESFKGYNAGGAGSPGVAGNGGGGGGGNGNSGTQAGGGAGVGGAGGGGGVGGGSDTGLCGGGGGGSYGAIGNGGKKGGGGSANGGNGSGTSGGAGGQGVYGGCGNYTCGYGGGGGGGGTYGATDLSKLYLGSAGGTGGQSVDGPGLGGKGGGIINIIANGYTMTGSVVSTGANGGSGTDHFGTGKYCSGDGGGGAGGSVYLKAVTATLGTNLITSLAGNGTGGVCPNGGTGGVGRIALLYQTSYTGTTNPTVTATQGSLTGTSYYSTATIQSTNILSGQYAHALTSAIYNLSAKPTGSTATIQFSQNATNWYNSSGSLNGTDTLTTGSNNTISLTGTGKLNWTGPNFYYKIAFGSDGTVTPVLDDLSLKYVGGVSPTVANSTTLSIPEDTYIVGVVDGSDPNRLIDGVDSGTGTTNTGTITISGGATVVLDSNLTVVAGSFVITSGSIVINTGAVLKPGGLLYAVDSDQDGYPGSANKLVAVTKGTAKPSNFTRRDSLASLSTVDCNDNAYSLTNTCTVGVGSACAADANCNTGLVCGTDADGDQLFSAALGHTGTCQVNNGYPYTDTNDGQYCATGYQPAGTCNKCVNGAITYQTSSQDLWNQCTSGNCANGNCSGTGSSCQSSGTWTCDQCNTSCCSIDPSSHCTSTTCGTCGANCGPGGANYCSGFDVWNGGHTCYCHYEPDLNCNPQSCNCSCR